MKRISNARMDYIRELWKCASEHHWKVRRERALRAFIKRVAEVSAPEFLTPKRANQIIDVIKSILERKEEESAQAKKMFIQRLSPGQEETLKKFNPFRGERDRLIRLLRNQGVSRVLLSKVSGLCGTSIHNILNKGTKKMRGLVKEIQINKEKGGRR
jgi:hypothetical protein